RPRRGKPRSRAGGSALARAGSPCLSSERRGPAYRSAREQEGVMASSNAAETSRPAFGRADLYVLFTALVWGATYPVAKPIVAVVDPFFFSATRYIVAALLLFAAMAASRQSLRV